MITQKHEGKEQVIEYASRAVSNTEEKLHSNVLECLAVHWALTEKFHIYVIGLPVVHVWTDNWSVSLMANATQLNRKFARMVLDLQELPLKIHHRSGTSNVVADALSRIPEHVNACLILTAENSHLALAQQSDAKVLEILEVLKNPALSTRKAEKIRNSFFVSETGIVCRKSNLPSGLTHTQIVIPDSLRQEVLLKFHDQRGHMDKSRTKSAVARKYWWSSMDRDLKDYIGGCNICQCFNRRTSKPVGFLHPRPVPNEPFIAISVDHIGPLPESTNGYKYILIAVDHTTRFVFTKAVSSTATSHAIVFLKELTFMFGLPISVVSDQGSGFMSQNMQKFLQTYNIEHITSCPYFHQANGLVERSVATLKTMLKKYCFNNPSTWDETLSKATSFINSSKQGSTKFSPFFLLFGYEPRLTSELTLGTVLPDVSRLQAIEMLHEIRHEAKANLEGALQAQKKYYDQYRVPADFKQGDVVLVDSNPTKPFDPRKRDRIFSVTETHVNDTCTVQDVSSGESKTVHVTQLRHFKRQPDLDPDIFSGTSLHQSTTNSDTRHGYSFRSVNCDDTHSDIPTNETIFHGLFGYSDL